MISAATGKAAAVIVAAGLGRRFKGRIPKQFMPLNGRPMFLWSVLAFLEAPGIRQIVLVVPPGYRGRLSTYRKKYGIEIVPGGKERPDSVRAGLRALGPDIGIVAVHDAARPLVTAAVINSALAGARRHGAALAAVPARDTVKSASGAYVSRTIPRNTVWQAQTPQVFKREILERAYRKIGGRPVTDDAQAAELAGYRVALTAGEYFNIKITDKNDLKIAGTLLKARNSSHSS